MKDGRHFLQLPRLFRDLVPFVFYLYFPQNPGGWYSKRGRLSGEILVPAQPVKKGLVRVPLLEGLTALAFTYLVLIQNNFTLKPYLL